jgi:hypothetical protein
MKKLVLILSVALIACSEKSEVAECCKEVVDVYYEISMSQGTVGRKMWYATKRDCEGNIVNEFVYMGSTRPQIYIGDLDCN